MIYRQNLGNCRDCGAPNAHNPRTGKTFCSEKCWLQNQDNRGRQNHQNHRQGNQGPNWDAIRAEKEASMEWLNAKNNATSIIVTLIAKGIPHDDAMKLFKPLVMVVYGVKQPNGNEYEAKKTTQEGYSEDVPDDLYEQNQ